jgi:hypothetical protein
LLLSKPSSSMCMDLNLVFYPLKALKRLIRIQFQRLIHVTLLQCGADPNATARVLLRSLKPSLHANVDCTALFAAIVSRQIAVVRHLLQVRIVRTAAANMHFHSSSTAIDTQHTISQLMFRPASRGIRR